jgi:type I restriction-modification system DNA methylase subunit
MAKYTITADTITPFLNDCGYTDKQLRRPYTYYFHDQERKIEIVGFSQAAYNSSTACIAVMDGNAFEEKEIPRHVLNNQPLGCPVVFVYKNDTMQFWHFSKGEPIRKQKIDSSELKKFFAQYQKVFSPDSIFRAKNFGRVDNKYQLTFVDLGLMSVIEKQEGAYLSDLLVRINESLFRCFENIQIERSIYKWLFQAGFWLIGAKILKDKGVPGFVKLNLSDINNLVEKVHRHYNSERRLDVTNIRQRMSLEKIAKEIVEPIQSLSHITTESLAYVYENSLVSIETRKAMGTHATPCWLVNYIVWQLVDWIEDIPEENRIILEPACGHAPFLTAGARILSFLYKGPDEQRHTYLKNHLIGIETDPFAGEIARLALTLSDIPNADGWQIKDYDIYGTDILEQLAPKATILLSNPPFENFNKEEKKVYPSLKTDNKAAEVLSRVFQYMQPGSVFGVILPQNFLHKKSLAGLRKTILDDFELRTICNLPDNVFSYAEHPCSVVLGRKSKSRKRVSYVTVTKQQLPVFKDTYQAEHSSISKEELHHAENYTFKNLQLKNIWEYCKDYPKLDEHIEVGRGIEYKSAERSVSKTKTNQHFQKGFARFKKYINNKEVDINIVDLPDTVWMSLDSKEIKNPRYGADIGKPQLLINYLRTSRTIWRIKGLFDWSGLPVTNNLLVARPRSDQFSLYVLWALINSPFTNAYIFDHCLERLNLEGVLRQMPVPYESQDLTLLDTLSRNYCSLHNPNNYSLENEQSRRQKKDALLSIDAEIMRLYDLPPMLEKRMLDCFSGYNRKGVDFEFKGYYPADFESCIPLHIFISKEYQGSTVKNVTEWVNRNRGPDVIQAIRYAAETRAEK